MNKFLKNNFERKELKDNKYINSRNMNFEC